MNVITAKDNRVLIAGDWHASTGDALHVLDYAADNDVDTILQVGDFGLWQDNASRKYLYKINKRMDQHGQQLFWLDGNHENFPFLRARYPVNTDGTRSIDEHITYMPRGWRFRIGNIDFMAFGGAYSVDRQWRTENRTWFAEEVATADQVKKALAGSPVDVLLMHDSPYPAPHPILDDPRHVAQGINDFGTEAIMAAAEHRLTLSPLLTHLQPHVLYHGHYHMHYLGEFVHPNGKRTNVISLDESTKAWTRMDDHAKIVDLDILYADILVARQGAYKAF